MKAIEFFSNVQVKRILAENKLENFKLIWSLDIGWFEEKNERRGGWSGVSRYQLTDKSSVFIKRQENHCFRVWYKFFKSTPTFYREFENIQKFTRLDIPTLDLLYFGQRKENGRLQAILVTQELDGYLPLDSELLKKKLHADFKLRKLAIQTVAEVVSHMHKQHLQHNCLYEKHIFLKPCADGSVDVRLIDLEKVKWKLFRGQIMHRDLGALFRHSEGWSKIDKLRFFLCYQNEDRLSRRSKKLSNIFLKKVEDKVKKKSEL